MIAATEPCRPIGRDKDRLDLGARQEAHLPLVVALARNRKRTLDGALLPPSTPGRPRDTDRYRARRHGRGKWRAPVAAAQRSRLCDTINERPGGEAMPQVVHARSGANPGPVLEIPLDGGFIDARQF